ncbi:E3 ubiquitin/ISG15 ligase TRIM25-like [Chelmon rostratus]|uniref:E3 ubiquitin/ISG15 ligase TRIM25-like n=1 Tax=Chelmon rostratus TaxID=109905 RepID=UPI001BE66D2E|nr:E3 ubiquitin/ISG15 ligase TRIM25-like [Chelmon rostratus]
MATASSFLSDDQFQCSICLDVFTEPVSVPCGHNFCKACIDRHWEGKEQCQCPLCNEKFNKGLKLRVNTEFREVVENFKKHHVNNSPVKPGQVPCDCCVGNKFKAAKTCLVCLTSYCEKHLEPHQRVAALKRHKLTNPVHNLDDKTCKKHNRILELFCRNDLTRVCVLCTEHSAHDVVPLEEPYVDKRALMGKEKAVAQEIKPKHGKKAKKMKVAEQTKRKGKNEAVTNCVACMRDPHIWLFEVEAEGRTGWDLGIVRESNLRKRTFTPSPRNGNWIIRFENNTTCHALDDVPVHLFLLSKPKRVLVFLDYDDGLVSFCDADTAVLIYTFTGCKFGWPFPGADSSTMAGYSR